MNSTDISQRIAEGFRLHQQGDLSGAELIYEEVLEDLPENTEVLYLLGTLKAQTSDFSQAESLLQRATIISPGHCGAHLNLGNIALEQQQFKIGERHYNKALQCNPLLYEAEFGIGRIYLSTGRYEEARARFEMTLKLKPGLQQAMACLGLALRHTGKHHEAVGYFREILRTNPDMPDIYAELGDTLQAMGRHEEAATAYLALIRARPESPPAYNNLGNMHRQLSRYDEAEKCYRKAIELDPGMAEAYNNLGNTLKVLGHHEQALSCYRHATDLDPEFLQAQSNLLLCLNYMPDYTQQKLLEQHSHIGNLIAPRLGIRINHPNRADPDRPLRIGYVSPDFRNHPVATFFEPLIENHNSADFEIVGYAEVPRPDKTTNRLRHFAQAWYNTVGMSDSDLAKKVRHDGIDILVDLAGHTARNRLPVFGLQPAPVQVSYLGYPNTTGITAIDYRLTDMVTDPAGTDKFCTEKLVRLEGGLTRYQPPGNALPVGPSPATTRGSVTFGSLNNLVKMNSQVFDLWSRVLTAMPDSRLLLFRDMLQGSILDRYKQEFINRGIDQDRLDLRSSRGYPGSHFSIYNEIDIALDPFPWNGHVTSCEALWMGVPVITLYGRTPAGRLCASILNQAGLDELVAKTPEEYINIAAGISRDRSRLEGLRKGLRARVANSILCDGASLARAVENAYRGMWYRWCSMQDDFGH